MPALRSLVLAAPVFLLLIGPGSLEAQQRVRGKRAPVRARAKAKEAKAKARAKAKRRVRPRQVRRRSARKNRLRRKAKNRLRRMRQKTRGKARRGRRTKARGSRKGKVRRFRMKEGRNTHAFHQSKRLAAHTVIRKGQKPRIVVATPAGNSGVGIWFDDVAPGAGELKLDSKPREVEHGGITGLSFTVSGPKELKLQQVLLDSVRALRDQGDGAYGERVKTVKKALAALDKAPKGSGAGELKKILRQWIEPKARRGRDGSLILERRSLGGARYRLELRPRKGTKIRGKGRRASLRGSRRTRFDVRVFIDRKPLTPFKKILRGKARKKNKKAERNLAFLSYKEANLAGSWQYLTYFGRDTLITNSLLADAAKPDALASAVTSVLDRVNRRGQVAHEENLADQAAFERIAAFAQRVASGKAKVTKKRLKALEKPLYDYKMIDGEYLLPQVADAYIKRAGKRGARATFTRERVDALARVASRVAKQTAGWQRKPGKGKLLRLRRGEPVGNWRDSEIGLGGGRVPLDVNAYLVPAALESFGRMMNRPGFPKKRFLAALAKKDRRAAKLFRSKKALRARIKSWQRARKPFEVKLREAEARKRLKAYLNGLPPKERKALAKQKLWSGKTVGDVILRGKPAPELSGVSFPAIALDGDGSPVPIQNSDEAFDLFYGQPTKKQVVSSIKRMFQPFPVGLSTPVGLVVSNPAYSNRRGDAKMFAKDKYHGAVIWGWPQKMILQGLDRQAARFKGDPEVQKVVKRAKRQLGRALERAGRFSASEVWTWGAGKRGRLRPVAFGQSEKHTDEANPLQYWTLPP